MKKVIWLTGLSGSGKTTIGKALDKKIKIHTPDQHIALLDGDILRRGINKDLGFTKEDREENIRRVGEITKILYDMDMIVIACFISPYEMDRQIVKNLIGEDFSLVYVSCPLDECIRRDTKGMYKKANSGAIVNFTGISQEYQPPNNANVVVETDKNTVDVCVEMILREIK